MLGGAVLLGLGGCVSDDENTLVVFGPDSAVVLAPLTAPAFLLPPTGTAMANGLELISFDPAALDAYGRQAPLDNEESWPYWNWWYGGSEWDMGTALGTEPAILGGTLDPRLPALTGTHSFDRSHWFVAGNAFGIGQDMFGYFCCGPPNSTVVVGLARLGLVVNGELDHSQVLKGEAVDEPDSLFFLGGSPGGDPDRDATLFVEYTAEFGANPWIFGYVPSDGSGFIGWWDVILSTTDASGKQIYGESGSPFDAYVAPNEQVRHSFPKYNYFVIWERNPDGSPDYSKPVARLQFGTDLSPLGGPINNAYGPFPTAALSVGELALGKGGVSRPDSVTLELENLKQLSGSAAYQVWAVLDDGSAQALSFTYVSPAGDTTVAANSFGGGEGVHEVTLEYPDNATHIVVSIESSAGAGSPSAAQILWAPGLQGAGQAKSLDLPVLFGTFGEQRVWSISGRGTGGLFGNEFRERYEHLPRPPVGYKYVGWLSSGDTLFVRLPDETFTSPPPEYTPLTDADVDLTVSEVVQPLEILESFTRICVREATAGCQGPYDLKAFDTFFLTLEPKSGMPDMPAPTKVLEALLPTPK
jgi:hypothetical protein